MPDENDLGRKVDFILQFELEPNRWEMSGRLVKVEL